MNELATMRYLSTTEDTGDAEDKILYDFYSVSFASSVVESFIAQRMAQR
jgi:hypothetical protein